MFPAGQIDGIVLGFGDNGINYNFGEFVPSPPPSWWGGKLARAERLSRHPGVQFAGEWHQGAAPFAERRRTKHVKPGREDRAFFVRDLSCKVALRCKQ